MLKLYKTIDGALHYHEAWVSDDEVVEHWGRVGERGETRAHTADRGKSDEENILAVLKEAARRGYQPVDQDDHRRLLIEYRIKGMGSEQDIEKRHRLEDRISETLGWTGLGMCDGGSIGSGSMEVCCFVVDFEAAKRVIANDLAKTEFADYSRIYDEDAG